MSRTITALFDTRADAEAGKQRLCEADVDADNVRILDQSSEGHSSSEYSTHQNRGIWGSIKNAFLPDEDRHTYEEGVRRGGFLLTADIDGDEADTAVRALESANSVDIDERSQSWRKEGWDYKPAAVGAAAGAGAAIMGTSKATPPSTAVRDTTAKVGTTGNEEVIRLAEEQLIVGKREVNRGGVKIRSYVTEKPVHEQISLREEHVRIDRQKVDKPLTGNVDAFQERTIEMTETSEEAVVGKTARVTEELVISKTADEHVETINETVRKTEVDVEQLGRKDMGGRTSTGSSAGTTGAGAAASTAGNKTAGLGNEAMGNTKQGLGGLTGNESLKQSGAAQERKGESQQGQTPTRKT